MPQIIILFKFLEDLKQKRCLFHQRSRFDYDYDRKICLLNYFLNCKLEKDEAVINTFRV